MQQTGVPTRGTRRIAGVLSVLLLLTVMASPSIVAAPSKSDKIDINTADVETLTQLPGVGKAIAQRIVDFRDKQGKFSRVEDLLKVKGIGEKSLEKLRPMVTVGKSG